MPTSKHQARHAASAGKLRACPQCGYDAIWVDQTFVVEFNGKLVGGRMMAFCNTTTCDQRYWFYPLTGRITRRNTGRFSAYYHRPVVKTEVPRPCVDCGHAPIESTETRCASCRNKDSFVPPTPPFNFRERLWIRLNTWCLKITGRDLQGAS